MVTKVFSSRVDEEKLAFADALTERELGLSFGQYCGTMLLDAIVGSGALPNLEPPELGESRRRAAETIRGFKARVSDAPGGSAAAEEGGLHG